MDCGLYLNGSLMMALPDVKEALAYIMTRHNDRDLQRTTVR
jgi:hypothetical protein